MSFLSRLLVTLLLLLAIAGCKSETTKSASTSVAKAAATTKTSSAPAFSKGPLNKDTAKALDVAISAFSAPSLEEKHLDAIAAVGKSGDARTAWLLADLLRLASHPWFARALEQASGELVGVDYGDRDVWNRLTNDLIAWDIPEPPDYLTRKRAIFTQLVPEWKALFTEPSEVDWRHVSWGGVDIDARAYDTTDERCRCIPAVDNPKTTSAADGAWLDDDAVVFGVSINGESRAYPRFIMEIREMVNDTLGGRDFGMPYCTLCGSAQVWFTDRMLSGVERPVLRTSGLLVRSNKLMFDVSSWSVFDTFLGRALSGPMLEKKIQLPAGSVVTTTWGEWKSEHPDTTILDRSLSFGRDSDLRNTRDADGPIFPIGDVDERLAVQADIVGVISSAGNAIAFDVPSALAALKSGQPVSAEGIHLALDGGGLNAQTSNGKPVASHQAFWFAWSQFRPDTKLWTGRN